MAQFQIHFSMVLDADLVRTPGSKISYKLGKLQKSFFYLSGWATKKSFLGGGPPLSMLKHVWLKLGFWGEKMWALCYQVGSGSCFSPCFSNPGQPISKSIFLDGLEDVFLKLCLQDRSRPKPTSAKTTFDKNTLPGGILSIVSLYVRSNFKILFSA